jgi:ADP-ribose pyrophosphatase
MTFKLLKSEVIYKARNFILRNDFLQTPDGREVKYDVVEHHGSVIIIPVDEHGNIYFITQYRHATGVEMLELPAGTLEADEDPLHCAEREIREETGMAAGEIRKLGGFFLAPGYSTEYMHVYLAKDLKHDPLEMDDDEFLENKIIPIKKAYAMAERGEIQDSKTLAALMLAKPFLS